MGSLKNDACLYLCATPIGNLDDITIRALNVLKCADLIACEDTRHTLKLLNHFNISKPLTSYHEHNKKEKGEFIISEIKNGKSVVLVTDAGTPAISDPGQDLVKMCIENEIRVIPLPGCVALVNALIISGLDTGRFCFEGFLSVNRKNRDIHIESLKHETRTMIFYEAPHKLVRTLKDMSKIFGDRKISLVRELTKIHEQAVYTTIDAAIEHYEENPPKGEFVLVVEGLSKEDLDSENAKMFDDISICDQIDELIESGIDKKEAIKKVALLRNLKKRNVYNEYIKVKG